MELLSFLPAQINEKIIMQTGTKTPEFKLSEPVLANTHPSIPLYYNLVFTHSPLFDYGVKKFGMLTKPFHGFFN